MFWTKVGTPSSKIYFLYYSITVFLPAFTSSFLVDIVIVGVVATFAVGKQIVGYRRATGIYSFV
jgi:hypothetical protein